MDTVVTAIERVVKGQVKNLRSDAGKVTEESENRPAHVEARL